ncbi:hypothetical protein DFH09DRAFT_426104 [Mycena vulgaris]|nr:hypothetical protein DFH09DRAFT_426104 [Mycena vulgaris]
MPLSRPLLPAELIEKIQSDDMMSGFVSEVFSPEFHRNRLMMRNWEAPLSPDSFHYIEALTIGWVAEMKRTPLHLAAHDGDVLAVYEMIGLGTTADKPDNSGLTPICLAVLRLAAMTRPHARGIRPDGGIMSALDFKREASRLKCVIHILVEQHAVLDRKIKGEPLITILCRSKAWETIALFLMHGATPPQNPTSLFQTASDRSKFTSMLQSRLQPGVRRPARKCPCWFGKSVEECHAKEAQPYPLEYVCVCGSGKTYKKCCFPRDSYVTEKWDPVLNRIMHGYDRFARAPELKKMMEQRTEFRRALYQALGKEFDERTFTGLEDIKPEHTRAQLIRLAEELLGQGLIDPAFAYPLSRVEFYPRPESKKCSRFLAKSRQKRWNALVDEYIDTQGDLRSRRSIERAAKIGKWNGALIRTCEGPDCGKFEETDIDKLRSCSRCEMSVYCSSDCQGRAWKTHKTKCATDEQQEQALPSQDTLKQYSKRVEAEAMRKQQELFASAPPLELLKMTAAMRQARSSP